MNTSFEFCLIVTTKNRVDEVVRLFDALAAQTHKNFTVILVDQNADDRLATAMARATKDFSITHVRTDPLGASAGRNVGLEHIPDSADIVTFPDDDCVYPKNLLAEVADQFAMRDLGVLAGRNLELSSAPIEPCEPLAPYPLTRYNVWRRGPTYVFFYHHQAIEHARGFDENLGPTPTRPFTSGEDTDFSIRACELGKENLKNDGITIYHPTFDVATDADYHKCLGYALGRKRVLQKHGYPAWFIAANVLYPLPHAARHVFSKKKFKHYVIQAIGRL